MNPVNIKPPLQRILEVVEYCSERKGLFYISHRQKARIGARFGRVSSGGRRGKIDGQDLFEHRLIWYIHTGQQPEVFIDHIDGNPLNNDIKNLRLATNQQNQANTGIWKTNQSSGVKGVSKNRSSWQARICVSGTVLSLGNYKTLEEAKTVYELAAKEWYGVFKRNN